MKKLANVTLKRFSKFFQEVVEDLQETKTNQPKVKSSTNQVPIPPHQKKSSVAKIVDLCLIVPASVIGNLSINDKVDKAIVTNLIDKSLYFLCTDENRETDEILEVLETTNEDIANLSEQREVYVRIKIVGGQEMIGKKVPYILKRNLPTNGESEVTQLACLKYLSISGLEKFNRV
ncbi:MAG: hypothetical protein H9536_15140 [Aphanizomenon flos-aquae Clear-A1]|nr:hypothetical protein [Aphanizomenon flos-aquae Clear-A1]